MDMELLEAMKAKQGDIQRAMANVTALRHAVANVTEEINRLRRVNGALMTRNTELRGAHGLILDPTKAPLAAKEDVAGLARVDLVRKFEDLYTRWTSEVLRNNVIQEEIVQMQNTMLARREEKEKYDALSEEHMDRARKLLKLQDEVGKLEKLKQTTVKQAAVIDKLEGIIATKLGGGARGIQLVQQLESLRKTNEHLKATVEREPPEAIVLRQNRDILRARLAQLNASHGVRDAQALQAQLMDMREQNSQLEKAVAELEDIGGRGTLPTAGGDGSAAALEANVRALEDQLEAEHAKNAKQVNEWKVHYAELLAQAKGGFGPSTATPLGGPGAGQGDFGFQQRADVAAQRPQPIFHRATGDLRKPSPNLSPL